MSRTSVLTQAVSPASSAATSHVDQLASQVETLSLRLKPKSAATASASEEATAPVSASSPPESQSTSPVKATSAAASSASAAKPQAETLPPLANKSSLAPVAGSAVTLLHKQGTALKKQTFDAQGNLIVNNPQTGVYDEIEIEDMDFDELGAGGGGTYTYPCPCGDKFCISVEALAQGDDIAQCESCSLVIRVIYDQQDFA